jgi:hypothetical protein
LLYKIGALPARLNAFTNLGILTTPLFVGNSRQLQNTVGSLKVRSRITQALQEKLGSPFYEAGNSD